MCEAVRRIYAPGAKLTIASDGLLFNDIIGVSDEDAWAYGEALVDIIEEKGFAQNIKFARAMDLLGLHTGPVDKDTYLALASTCRNRLLAEYGRSEDEFRARMAVDDDTGRTLKGIKLFLRKDLKYTPMARALPSEEAYRDYVETGAMAVMIRSESFTDLIAARCPTAVRLSVHPSTGNAKLTVPLIEILLDPHAEDVRQTHTLVRHPRDGRPYYYRKKSPLWDDPTCWNGDEVVFEPVYPHGLLVYPRISASQKTLSDKQTSQLRALARQYRGRVIVSGFTNAAAELSALAQNTDSGGSTSSALYQFMPLCVFVFIILVEVMTRSWCRWRPWFAFGTAGVGENIAVFLSVGGVNEGMLCQD
ncbi:Pyoverdine/dityrosine biosynthesis protein-domain-containing protein [Apiospora hydei]|uniref:Pyoverdine/dityrosine biosynthesis protein-domain-containing protein n=1 Tax=Apiospora hydei TaxID=1337664 RepID=A0ABR1VH68_9PEZI